MDTPTIAKYYREKEPMERLKLLEQSIAAEEDPEGNRIRKELWEIRYSDESEAGDTRADGYLGLWMTMEFNRNSSSRFFGTRSAKKEIGKYLTKLKFQEIQEKGGLYQELLYRECCHMVLVYMDLCQTDKSYNTTLCGLIHIKEDSAKSKLQRDIRETAVDLPGTLGMESELGIITRAAREIYRQYYPNEGNI
ncbi:MAG: hypothetical protein Q4P27_03965 [Eubacteriales bacterium]|nr:hypothetical protein [Eubacteriales bacterium]